MRKAGFAIKAVHCSGNAVLCTPVFIYTFIPLQPEGQGSIMQRYDFQFLRGQVKQKSYKIKISPPIEEFFI